MHLRLWRLEGGIAHGKLRLYYSGATVLISLSAEATETHSAATGLLKGTRLEQLILTNGFCLPTTVKRSTVCD